MGTLFWPWRKHETAEVTPVARRESAEEKAVCALEKAVSELSTIVQEYRALQAAHDLLLDTSGNIVHCALSNPAMRPALERQSRDLVKRHTAAVEQFNQRCREYAGLKGTQNATDN